MTEKSQTRLGKRIADLDERVANVAREQRRINQLLKVQDNIVSETKEWIEKSINVRLQGGNIVGSFKWMDKYQIAVIPHDRCTDDPVIIPKSAIQFIERAPKIVEDDDE